MTLLQFRQSEPLVVRMREILNDPVFVQLIIALREETDPVDVVGPEVASVRQLSALSGYASCLRDLISSGTLLDPAKEEEEATWGVNEPPKNL